MRTERARALAMPGLISPALQVSMRAGEVPTGAERPMLRVPINRL